MPGGLQCSMYCMRALYVFISCCPHIDTLVIDTVCFTILIYYGFRAPITLDFLVTVCVDVEFVFSTLLTLGVEGCHFGHILLMFSW